MHSAAQNNLRWFKACRLEEVPKDGGVCVKLGAQQIAVFRFSRRDQWYATQNLCPHKQQMVLSRGLIGESAGEPKVACPFHKKTFSLETGGCLSDPEVFSIRTYPVKTEEGFVLLGLEEETLADVCP